MREVSGVRALGEFDKSFYVGVAVTLKKLGAVAI
jgi:hypothetical protein